MAGWVKGSFNTVKNRQNGGEEQTDTHVKWCHKDVLVSSKWLTVGVKWKPSVMLWPCNLVAGMLWPKLQIWKKGSYLQGRGGEQERLQNNQKQKAALVDKIEMHNSGLILHIFIWSVLGAGGWGIKQMLVRVRTFQKPFRILWGPWGMSWSIRLQILVLVQVLRMVIL